MSPFGSVLVARPAPSVRSRQLWHASFAVAAVLGLGIVAWFSWQPRHSTRELAQIIAARRAPEVLPWVLSAPLLAVGAAYAVRPWGDVDGWAGTWAWPAYLALVPVVGVLALAGERRDRGRRAFSRRDGRSTSR